MYKVPKKNLKNFEVSKRDSINGNYDEPSKKYLVSKQENSEVKLEDRPRVGKQKGKERIGKNDNLRSRAIENGK